MSIGTILNINPKGALKASTTVATAATKTLTHMVQKEAVDVAATIASKNVSKATPWFKSFNPYSQVTQKTSQVAERYVINKGMTGAEEFAKLGLKDGMKCSTSEALELGQQFLGKSYKEVVANTGRYVSSDGKRAFRMGVNDILGKHGGGPHVNFETLTQNSSKLNKMIVERNYHIYLID
jgi:hypothetical protein